MSNNDARNQAEADGALTRLVMTAVKDFVEGRAALVVAQLEDGSIKVTFENEGQPE